MGCPWWGSVFYLRGGVSCPRGPASPVVGAFSWFSMHWRWLCLPSVSEKKKKNDNIII